MKVPLLATTIIAAYQFQPTGDPVKPFSSRITDLIGKTSYSPTLHLLSKLPLPKLPSQFGSDTLKAVSPKVPLPLTPASNPMAKYDYRKGDEATTVEAFTEALKDDFRVTSNKQAKIPEIFTKNPIMVYGEVHSEPTIPSLRTPKGVLLLESEDPNRCMPKHKLDISNRCISIDTKKADMSGTVIECARHAQTIVELIKPGAMAKIMSRVAASSGQATAMIQEAYNFVNEGFDAAYIKSSSPRERAVLEKARNTFFDSVHAFDQMLLEARGGDRDQSMMLKCETAIRQLPTDASATVVVGDIHSQFLAKQLSKQFPDRAVVLARSVKSPVA